MVFFINIINRFPLSWCEAIFCLFAQRSKKYANRTFYLFYIHNCYYLFCKIKPTKVLPWAYQRNHINCLGRKNDRHWWACLKTWNSCLESCHLKDRMRHQRLAQTGNSLFRIYEERQIDCLLWSPYRFSHIHS